jgi:hypothetical protein
MKLLKNLSLMSLIVMFLISFSCTPKSTETEEAAAEEIEAVETEAVVEEESEPKMDSTAMDMMDSTAVEVIEAVDSASMEN